MLQNKQYLLISESGRALCTSAKNAGIDVHVIDLFADQDTIANSLSSHAVSAFSGKMNATVLIKKVRDYVAYNPSLSIVIGSGFEGSPHLLAQLQQICPILGNHHSVINRINSPACFFKQLDSLSLPYPEYLGSDPSRSDPGRSTETLLIKSAAGTGGRHISVYVPGMPVNPPYYLQVFLSGKNYSATFIADGHSFNLLGFNATWTRAGKIDFSFAGAVSNVWLPDVLRVQIIEAIRKLVQRFKLRGLCGLDFIIDPIGSYAILELNPRPTATFEMYEDQEQSLFAQHILALQQPLSWSPSKQYCSRALGICYAEQELTVPDLGWPDWITDKPRSGTIIAKDAPICTVHASGSTATSALKNLALRLDRQKECLGFTSIAA